MDEEWEEYNPGTGLSFGQYMLAGSFAGLMEHVTMFPVDTLKTQLQADRGSSLNSRKLIQALLAEGGFPRMWRGVQTMLTGCMPAHAAYFSVYETMKKALGGNGQGHHPFAIAAAGAASVCIHDVIMTPLDVAKQRLQLGYYKGMVDCLRSVIQQEGILALYRSYTTTLFMNIPYHAVMTATNESFKILFGEQENSAAQVGRFLISGACAGAVAAALTNPLDVAKTRLQTQGLTPAIKPQYASASSESVEAARRISHTSRISTLSDSHKSITKITRVVIPSPGRATLTTMFHPKESAPAYKGLRDALTAIWKEEGLAGFMKGVRPRLLVHAPSSAICWTAYEGAKRLLLNYQQ